VPLTHGDRLLGVLTVEAPLETPLDQNDLNWLMNIGRQISSAVENARLNADLEAALQQEQATRAQLVQNEKLAAMGKLVASVAHELNNPLQAIQNALFLVQQEHDLSEQTRADLDVAATETHRMADLIARLRDTYRPATGEQFQPEQVNAIVEDVHRLIATHLRQSQVAFDFRPDPELPPVLAIRDQLKQAILNLSINAVEAMSASGQLTIETHYVPPANEVSLSVSDTGSGIDPADLPNVFDPFFTTKASGTGLGLAITHDIARRHGGRLEVSSELGRGSTFILHLPVSGPPPGAGILQSK
jgi:two-component system NtrC family sensor kinase